MLTAIYSKNDWDATLQSIKHYDFYHTYDYHNITKGSNELPLLLVYAEDRALIALPLLIRPIENSKFRDATSVYGYGGPVHSGVDLNFDLTGFKKALSKYFIENDIITLFSRLNPFINGQEYLLEGLGSVSNLGKIVNIDLTRTLANQKSCYNRRLKSQVNKTKELCHIKTATTAKEFYQFIELYNLTMHRVEAHEQYYFNESYFNEMMQSRDFKAEIRLCIENSTGNALAGVLFVFTNNIVQYHLSASKERYQGIYPTQMIIDETREIANAQGYTFFNLGGGLGNEDDSLFRFKSNFSDDFKTFKIWQWIINENATEQLENTISYKDTFEFKDKGKKFFPRYRIKI